MSFDEIYLDNSATTKCDDEAAALMMKVYTQDYGNPSSVHRKGIAAEQYVRDALERISGTLKCGNKEIVFTSGGNRIRQHGSDRSRICAKTPRKPYYNLIF